MVNCWCQRPAVVRTSWTAQNPGRRFYGCPKTGSDCKFVDWVDPPVCARCMDIIHGLLRSNNLLEGKVKDAEKNARMMMLLLICSWVAFVMYVYSS